MEDVIKLRIHVFANGEKRSLQYFLCQSSVTIALVTVYGNIVVTLNDLCLRKHRHHCQASDLPSVEG
jgi:hypothetical protein